MAENLPENVLQQILQMRQGQGVDSGGGQVWYNALLGGDDPNNYVLHNYPGQREQFGGNAQQMIADPSLDQNFITRLVQDTGGNLGDRWDLQGNYLGQTQLNNGGGKDFNQGVLMALPAVAGIVSAGAGAGGTSAAAVDSAALGLDGVAAGGAAGGAGAAAGGAGAAAGGAGAAAGGAGAGAAGLGGAAAGGGGGAAGAGGAMGWGNWASLAGNLASSAIQSNASRQAANGQADAARQSNQMLQDQYNQTVQRNQPFVTGGTSAFNALLDRLGLTGSGGGSATFDPGTSFQAPTADQVMAQPGYQFGLQQGQTAMDRQNAARGTSYSGAALAQAARYGNDYATGQYNNEYNRLLNQNNQAFNQRLSTFNTNQQADQQGYNQLANIAGMGQNAANNTGNAGATFASSAGNNLQSAANVNGANSIAQGNIWGNALNQGISQWNQNQGRSSYGGNGVNMGSTGWTSDQAGDPWYMGG